MNQSFEIYYHLCVKQKPLTPIEALNKYGCFRLSARVHDLRTEGFNIQTIRTKENGKTYATYLYKPKDINKE
tara:strand:- start:160 stop:375 length:216 start_codon:yes stop_codon:yes gene_type:complete